MVKLNTYTITKHTDFICSFLLEMQFTKLIHLPCLIEKQLPANLVLFDYLTYQIHVDDTKYQLLISLFSCCCCCCCCCFPPLCYLFTLMKMLPLPR